MRFMMRKMLPLCSMFFLLGFVMLSHVAADATYYVDRSGSPACANSSRQAGSQAAPWCSIPYALTRMSGGDTVQVKNGTYTGDFVMTGPSGSAGAPTIIQNFLGHNPVLQGSGGSGHSAVPDGRHPIRRGEP